jgi:hypothetical protein
MAKGTQIARSGRAVLTPGAAQNDTTASSEPGHRTGDMHGASTATAARVQVRDVENLSTAHVRDICLNSTV